MYIKYYILNNTPNTSLCNKFIASPLSRNIFGGVPRYVCRYKKKKKSKNTHSAVRKSNSPPESRSRVFNGRPFSRVYDLFYSRNIIGENYTK